MPTKIHQIPLPSEATVDALDNFIDKQVEQLKGLLDMGMPEQAVVAVFTGAAAITGQLNSPFLPHVLGMALCRLAQAQTTEEKGEYERTE